MKENSKNILYLIPARGGSKGVPRKNILPLAGKPLIYYAIDAAREVASDNNICVSTDDEEIKRVVEDYGLRVPFIRPSKIATDTASTNEVIIHAINNYEKKEKSIDIVVLLQVTSPFRTGKHILEVLELYNPGIDMVASVKETKANPYYTLKEEDKNGFLQPSKTANFKRRQDCPKVYEFNGAVYIINASSLKQKPMHQFEKVKKYVMDEKSSHDIDTEFDWEVAELIVKQKILNKDM